MYQNYLKKEIIMNNENSKYGIIVGSSCPDLGWKINDLIKTPHSLINPNTKTFPNGEKFCAFNETVRGKICFVIQSISASDQSSINDNLMELLLITDALKRASAQTVIAVIPFLGYARQDRRVQSRSPISSRLIADLIQSAGVDHLITMDLHSMQGEGFYKIPFDNLSGNPIIVDHIKEKYDLEKVSIISPDIGGVSRARNISVQLGTSLAIIDKRRDVSNNQPEVMNLIGDVKNKTCIIIDDMIDTGGTIKKAINYLKKEGAEKVIVYGTHGLFSSESYIMLNDIKDLDKLYVLNTVENIYITKKYHKINFLNGASIFAKCIDNIMNNESIGVF